ncbi:MAG TPA: histidine kinase [Chitinophagaceae bacterium]|nr:histidine kinase [Chitinophagaceae bacterium]
MKHKPQKINDTVIKFAGIPFTGVLAFHLSGFASAAGINSHPAIINYSCFIFISFCLWNGSAYAHYLLRNQLYKIKKLYFRIPARYSITIAVTWIISYILLICWNYFLHDAQFTQHGIIYCQLIMTLISIQVSSIYEIVYLNKERESDLIKIERSEKLKVQAQLDALKSQIDPHFIFNSLNTLSYLISQDQEKAKLFNDTLAKVYRYILINKEKDLIQLKQEIEFASNYFYLLKIRYQAGLNMLIKMDNVSIENYSIPPLSLQALIENAIKHNYFSEKINLSIEITISEDEIRVVNHKNIKKYDIQSSRIGLANLNERYSLIVNKDIIVSQTPDFFTVLLPVIKSV